MAKSERHHLSSARKPGRPALLTNPEVITLAILTQRPRFRSERDSCRFASARLRPYETTGDENTRLPSNLKLPAHRGV